MSLGYDSSRRVLRNGSGSGAWRMRRICEDSMMSRDEGRGPCAKSSSSFFRIVRVIRSNIVRAFSNTYRSKIKVREWFQSVRRTRSIPSL